MTFVISCTVFANENTSFFIGQIEGETGLQNAFILQIQEQDFKDRIRISDTGEIFIKIDKILSVDKSVLNTHVLCDSQIRAQETSVKSSHCAGYSFQDERERTWTCPVRSCKAQNEWFYTSCWKCGAPRD